MSPSANQIPPPANLPKVSAVQNPPARTSLTRESEFPPPPAALVSIPASRDNLLRKLEAPRHSMDSDKQTYRARLRELRIESHRAPSPQPIRPLHNGCAPP